MDAGGFSASNIATTVWANVTRSITSIGTAVTAFGTSNGSLATASSLDMRPAAAHFRSMSLATTLALNNSTFKISLWDGVTSIGLFTAENWGIHSSFATASIGPVLANSTGASQAYTIVGWDWS